MNKLMFPYAIEKDSNKIVSPSEVKNGKQCNCVCFQCKQNMIAINNPENKQKPHFRHDVDSNCNVNFETFIHWITKEIFKKIDILYIPEIDIDKVKIKIESKLAPIFNENKSPKKLREIIIDELVQKVGGVNKIQIQNVSIEESFKTSEGDIRVDIVLRFKNKNNETRILFIEPYFSSQIDYVKLAIIKKLNVSTISINLIDFIAKKSHLFDIKELRAFIVNDIKSKNWVYYNLDKLLSDKKIETVKKKLFDKSESINKHKSIMQDIKQLYDNINIIETQIKELYIDLGKLKNEVRIKYEEIDKIDY